MAATTSLPGVAAGAVGLEETAVLDPDVGEGVPELDEVGVLDSGVDVGANAETVLVELAEVGVDVATDSADGTAAVVATVVAFVELDGVVAELDGFNVQAESGTIKSTVRSKSVSRLRRDVGKTFADV